MHTDDSDYIWFEDKNKVTYADMHEYPWAVIVVRGGVEEDEKYCGGTLISPWLVLTSKSCAPKTIKGTFALLGERCWS